MARPEPTTASHERRDLADAASSASARRARVHGQRGTHDRISLRDAAVGIGVASSPRWCVRSPARWCQHGPGRWSLDPSGWPPDGTDRVASGHGCTIDRWARPSTPRSWRSRAACPASRTAVTLDGRAGDAPTGGCRGGQRAPVRGQRRSRADPGHRSVGPHTTPTWRSGATCPGGRSRMWPRCVHRSRARPRRPTARP